MTALVTEPRLRFESLGYRFDVVTDDKDLAERVAGSCQDLRRHGRDDNRPVTTYRLVSDHATATVDVTADAEQVVTGSEPWHALAMLLWHVNQQTTQQASRTHTVLHAAAATWNGRAIVLPAPMESGKTTTVTGLVLDGFGYLTDEAAAIHPEDLHVEPFPKGLSIDDGSWEVLGALAPLDAGRMPLQWSVPVSTIAAPGGGIAERAPVELIIFPRYQAGVATRLEPMGRAEAVLGMSRSTFHFVDAPERNLRTLAETARRARGCYLLTIGSLGDAVALVRRLVEER